MWRDKSATRAFSSSMDKGTSCVSECGVSGLEGDTGEGVHGRTEGKSRLRDGRAEREELKLRFRQSMYKAPR